MTKKRFTDREDEIIVENYSAMTNSELSKLLPGNHTLKQIKWRAKALGVSKSDKALLKVQRTKSNCWTSEEIEILRKVYPHSGAEGVAELVDRSLQSIKMKASRMNINVTEERLSESRSHDTTKNLDVVICRLCGEEFHLFNRVEDKYMEDGLCGECRNRREATTNRKWRTKILDRDDYTCQMCGAQKDEMHAHHILPRRDFPQYEFETVNGVTLCAECHYNIHFDEYSNADYFLDKIEKQECQSKIAELSRNIPLGQPEPKVRANKLTRGRD